MAEKLAGRSDDDQLRERPGGRRKEWERENSDEFHRWTRDASSDARLFGIAAPFKSVFDALPVPALVINPEYETLTVNRAALDLLALPDAEAVDPLAFFLPEADRGAFYQHIDRALERGIDGPLIVKVQDRSRRMKETALWSRAFDGPPGFGLLCSTTLVPFAELTKGSRPGLNLGADFFSALSHEVRAPINAILGFGSLITKLDPTEAEYLDHIRVNARALLSLIDGLVDFGRADSGLIVIEQAPFDIRQTIESVIMEQTAAAQARKIDLYYDLSSQVSGELNGDVRRIREVLSLLVAYHIHCLEQGDVGLIASTAKRAPLGARLDLEVIGRGSPVQGMIRDGGDVLNGLRQPRFEAGELQLGVARRIVELLQGTIGHTASDSFASTKLEFNLQVSGSDRQPEVVRTSSPSVFVKLSDEPQAAALVHMLQSLGCSAEAVRVRGETKTIGAGALQIVDRSSAIELKASKGRSMLLHSVWEPNVPGMHSLVKPVLSADLAALVEELLHEEARPEAAPGVSAAEPLRIAVVDHNDDGRRLLLLVLARLGYQAQGAASGRELIEMYQREKFNLIFMDVAMPEMDGYETARAIRELERVGENRARIIALTGMHESREEQQSTASGMDEFLSKPYSESDIFKLINRPLSPSS